MPAVVKRRKALAVRGEPEDDGEGVRDGDFERDELGSDMEHFFGQEDDEGRENTEDFLPITADGRLRLRPEIALDGPQYAGRKSSRKRVLEEGESEEEQGDSDSDIVNGSRAAAEDDDISEEEGDGLGWQAGDKNDDALEALGKEYEELREQEELILRNLKTEGTSDVQKGWGVRNQKALWDRGVEHRIFSQKFLSGANRLPRSQAMAMFTSDARIKNSSEALIQAGLRTLGRLLDLEQAIFKQNPAITEAFSRTQTENGTQETVGAAESSQSISSVDEAWEQMNVLYARLVPYRNSSLDRWQRKTQLSTGAAASKLKLRAFNQSIAEQVGAIMRDPSRIVNRMRSRKSTVHVLGQARASNQADGHTLSSEEVDDGDPESFDDSEFYQQLLQEFLESSAHGVGDMDSYAVRKLRNKKRKVVDRRASKGRKIRYNVFDPLVNFCAPEPMTLAPMAEKLFGNLFGQTKRDKS